MGLWRLTAQQSSEIFGVRLNCKCHGHHVFRAYRKKSFVKQYGKFAMFVRNEVCSHNLADFRLKKRLDHLDAIWKRFQSLTDRFLAHQAQWLNVHIDFLLLQRMAWPV